MSRLQTWLGGIGAHSDFVVLAANRTLQQLWDECDRGDRMLWILRRMAGTPGWPTVQTVVGLCCDCAELAKERWRGDAPAKCIATLRAWRRGEVTIDEVRAAASEVVFAADNGAANSASVYAAYAAYDSVADDAAADAAAAAIYAASAAYASYDSSADSSAARAAYASTLRQCAEIVRAAVPTLPEIDRQEGGEA